MQEYISLFSNYSRSQRNKGNKYISEGNGNILITYCIIE